MGAEAFSIRPFVGTDLDVAVEFFRRVYAPGHIVGEPGHLCWQFLEHPGADGARRSLLLFQGSSVKGHLGIIPQRTKVGNEIMLGGWCANLVTDTEIRDRGAGAFLLREAAGRFDLLLTTGYNAQAEPVLKGLGWVMLPVLNRRILVLRSERLGIEAAAGLSSPDTVFKIEKIDRFKEDWDEAWQTLRQRFPCTTERDSAYLNWRFIDHPRLNYVVLSAANGNQLHGYGVLRLERSPELCGARIVDLVASDESAPAILGGLIDQACAAGADFVDFFCSGSWYAQTFEEAGFVSADRQPFAGVPTFLFPVDRRRSDITFAIWKRGGGLGDPQDWYVVKADGDKDRAPGRL